MPIESHLRFTANDRVRLLLVVEGTNDIEFLTRISHLLSLTDHSIQPLASLQQSEQLLFVPFGGGDMRLWSHRLAPLGRHEFHLVDAEGSPETEVRREVIREINRRPLCRGVVTTKRSLENYLHCGAIFEASQLRIDVQDHSDVAEEAARKAYQRGERDVSWEALSARARKRYRDRAKRWLNTRAVDCMTPDRLAERDPAGELAGWLREITRLAIGE